jgi:YD repeat-containing protein
MGVRRAILACLVTSALTVTGAGVSAAAVPTAPLIQAGVEPPGALAPAVTEPLNPGTTESLALSGDDLPPAAGPDGIMAGNRKAAQMVSRNLTDTVKLGWNPATGNIVLTGKLLHLEGADRDIDLSWRYNSINDHRPTLSEGTPETALTVGADDSVTYTAADGGTYKFVPKTGGGWTIPAGLNASITAFSATAVTLRFNDSGETNFYQNVNGTYRLTHTGHHYSATADRNVYAYDGYGRLASITTPNGRQVTYEYQDSGNEESPSKITDQTLGRSIWIDYDSDGRMKSLIDADGKETLFSFSNGRLVSLTDARGTRTDLSYGSDGKAAEIVYAAYTGAEAVHALTPVDATTSHLTDGDGRTTVFTFNAARQVTQVTDPLGHTSKKTYNNHDDVLTDTDSLGNLTTSTYNPNNTLKNVTSPATGAAGTGKQVSYTYPAATAGEAWLEFQPLTAVDSEGSTTSFTYDTVTQRPYQVITPSGQGGTLINRYQGDAAGGRTDHVDHRDQHLRHRTRQARLYLHHQRHHGAGRGAAQDHDRRNRSGHHLRVRQNGPPDFRRRRDRHGLLDLRCEREPAHGREDRCRDHLLRLQRRRPALLDGQRRRNLHRASGRRGHLHVRRER